MATRKTVTENGMKKIEITRGGGDRVYLEIPKDKKLTAKDLRDLAQMSGATALVRGNRILDDTDEIDLDDDEPVEEIAQTGKQGQ